VVVIVNAKNRVYKNFFIVVRMVSYFWVGFN
jgi:hypothetical protein